MNLLSNRALIFYGPKRILWRAARHVYIRWVECRHLNMCPCKQCVLDFDVLRTLANLYRSFPRA
jgi:hypothetical protein